MADQHAPIIPTPALTPAEQRWLETESMGNAALGEAILRREAMIDYIAEQGGARNVPEQALIELGATYSEIQRLKQPPSGP